MAATMIQTPTVAPMDTETFVDSGPVITMPSTISIMDQVATVDSTDTDIFEDSRPSSITPSTTTTVIQTPPIVSMDTNTLYHRLSYSRRRSSTNTITHTPTHALEDTNPCDRPQSHSKLRSSSSTIDETSYVVSMFTNPSDHGPPFSRRHSSRTAMFQTPTAVSEDTYNLQHAQPSSIMSSIASVRAPNVASVNTHTMGASLTDYLLMKIHPDIHNETWSRIIVKGLYKRDPSVAGVPSSIEKTDKPFNWQCPTTSTLDSNTLQLNIFPGDDYVQHYAAIIATYLSLQGRDPNVVQYTLPSMPEYFSPLIHSNLAKMGIVEIVILGYVNGLDRWTSEGEWEDDDINQLFSWKKMLSKRGYRIAFLGCRICYWGDIGGNVVRELQRLNNAKCSIYLGKLGTLCPEHIPNQTLATGGQSLISSRSLTVTWSNPLTPYLHHAPSSRVDIHYSMPSVLDEAKEWLASAEKEYDFVDPEIGQMAKAAEEGGRSTGICIL